MSRQMTVSFPGGKRVNAAWDSFEVATDQSEKNGGDGSAPEPFDLFLASLATCAGVYVLGFCQKRNIPHDGISLHQSWDRDEKTKQLTTVNIAIEVPAGFPAKYHCGTRPSGRSVRGQEDPRVASGVRGGDSGL